MADKDFVWWQDGVIYHVYLRSFADSDGDGLGDLRGLLSRLDHLNGSPDSLGIDAVWISPCFPSPDKDFGYDVGDYRDIDPRYGTLADFDRLVEAAHQRGIRVMLDLVFNHSSDQHAWFRESRASRHNPRRDWYIWRDPRPGGRPPNNWQAVFGGKAWEWDERTRQFYLHLFLKEQPDLNWRNPAVPQELMDTVRFWLDRGVDGFRLDVFSAWFKHLDFRDNPPRLGLRGFDRQRHIYDINQPEMYDALADFRGVLDDYPERAAVGEPFGQDIDLVASYCGKDRLHLAFNFRFTHCPWNPAEFLRSIQEWDAALPDYGWPCYVLSNHDVSRPASRYARTASDSLAKVAAALLLTQRGTPFIYYGEEIGMRDAPLKHSQIVDPPGRRFWPFYKGRDPARSPMQWDASPHAGFTTGEPWLPLHPDHPSRNVQAQRGDPHSVFAFYRDLIRLRRHSQALRRGRFQPLTPEPRNGLAYLRSGGAETALVALNFTPRPACLHLDGDLPRLGWELGLSSVAHPFAAVSGREVRLAPYEAAVFLGH